MVNHPTEVSSNEKGSRTDRQRRIDTTLQPSNQSSPVEEKDAAITSQTVQPAPLRALPKPFDVDLEAGTFAASQPPETPASETANELDLGAERIRRRARAGVGPHPHFRPGARRANSLPIPAAGPTLMAMPTGPQPSLSKSFNQMLQPEKKIAPEPGWKDSAINIVKARWLNVLLIFVPISWATHYAGLSDTIVFTFSFLAIIPCASLLGFATEELALRMGQTLGGLLNATFGNAVELIIAILALVKGELRIVQASMLGSILSNCLLVLGMCFFAGGLRFHEQGYGVRAAQLNISLLSISVFSIVIPAAFHSSLGIGRGDAIVDTSKEERSVLIISRGTATILLVVYAAYLLFQLWTHAYIYSAEASAWHSAQTHAGAGLDGPGAPVGRRVFALPQMSSGSSSSSSSSSSSASSISTLEGEEVPKLKRSASLILLVIVTGITGLTAEFLVGSIDGLTKNGSINREFVALILLPLVGNAAEHITAVTVSVKNKLDLAITVAVGSSIQISLFVIPFLVILGWIIGQPLTLFFDIFETVVVFVSILVVNYAISDGKTNWLEGLVLMTIWGLIALSAYFYPV